ncbi:TPA: antiterminator Q family protein [Salmonella enterica subsp. enterica serovar Java]
MRDIQQVLERWGAWAANEGDSVYYQPVAAGFKGVLPFSRRTRESCSDNDGLIVSSAVGVLKKKDPYLYTLLEWYYVHSVPVRTIGSRLGVSHTAINKRAKKEGGTVVSTEVSNQPKVSSGNQSGNPSETSNRKALSKVSTRKKAKIRQKRNRYVAAVTARQPIRSQS